MKTVTEFPNFSLNQGINLKASLAAEGKTVEEIHQNLQETFKLDDNKIKHFIASLEVANQNKENLKRVLVVSLAEGEKAPPNATKIEEMHYVPEFHIDRKHVPMQKTDGKGGRGKGRGGRGGGGGNKKESPWGLSPEEKAAKAAKGSGPKPSKPN